MIGCDGPELRDLRGPGEGNDLFQCGVGVEVLEGVVVGEHARRSLILDLVLALSEDRSRGIVRKTRNGLEAARERGRVDAAEDDPRIDAPVGRRRAVRR